MSNNCDGCPTIVTVHSTRMQVRPPLIRLSNTQWRYLCWALTGTFSDRAYTPRIQQVRPTFVQVRPTFVQVRPTFVQVRPTFVQVRPTFVQVRPTFVQVRPTFVQVRSSYFFSLFLCCFFDVFFVFTMSALRLLLVRGSVGATHRT